LNGLSVAFIGDGRSNTCNSFLEACAAFGMHLTVASPPGHEMDPAMMESAEAAMGKSGGSVTLTTDPHVAVCGVNAVYAEVWVPMDKHHESAERSREFGRYRVDSALLADAPRDAMVLHCLPACRGEEITSEVLDGPRSLVWNQAANRLPTAQAVLYTFATRGFC
jgi:ornithine carbamoyltransferase